MKTRSKQLLHTITYDVVSLTLRVFSRHVDRPLSTQKKNAPFSLRHTKHKARSQIFYERRDAFADPSQRHYRQEQNVRLGFAVLLVS